VRKNRQQSPAPRNPADRAAWLDELASAYRRGSLVAELRPDTADERIIAIAFMAGPTSTAEA